MNQKAKEKIVGGKLESSVYKSNESTNPGQNEKEKSRPSFGVRYQSTQSNYLQNSNYSIKVKEEDPENQTSIGRLSKNSQQDSEFHWNRTFFPQKSTNKKLPTTRTQSSGVGRGPRAKSTNEMHAKYGSRPLNSTNSSLDSTTKAYGLSRHEQTRKTGESSLSQESADLGNAELEKRAKELDNVDLEEELEKLSIKASSKKELDESQENDEIVEHSQPTPIPVNPKKPDKFLKATLFAIGMYEFFHVLYFIIYIAAPQSFYPNVLVSWALWSNHRSFLHALNFIWFVFIFLSFVLVCIGIAIERAAFLTLHLVLALIEFACLIFYFVLFFIFVLVQDKDYIDIEPSIANLFAIIGILLLLIVILLAYFAFFIATVYKTQRILKLKDSYINGVSNV